MQINFRDPGAALDVKDNKILVLTGDRYQITFYPQRSTVSCIHIEWISQVNYTKYDILNNIAICGAGGEIGNV